MIQRTLLLAGFALTLLPQMVHAADCPDSDRAKFLLSKDPIGHYTKEVLDRAEVGVQAGKNAPGGSSVIAAFDLEFLIELESIFYMLLDTDLHAVEYERNLTTLTPCLHLDLAILESKMEEVRCEINDAYDRGSSRGIRKLKSVADFLKVRYKHLVKGGILTEYEDNGWSHHFSFEPPFEGSCCDTNTITCTRMTSKDCKAGLFEFYPTHDECLVGGVCPFREDNETSPIYETICPFDSDYLAYDSSGYGCELEVYERFAGTASDDGIRAEIDANKKLAEQHTKFLEDIDHIKDTTLNMDEKVDETMLNDEEREQLERFGETKTGEVEHKRVYGCNADVPPEEREDSDGVEGDLTPGVKPSEEWTAMPLRTPFSVGEFHLGVWKQFLRRHQEWASQREFPRYMKKPDEFFDLDDRKKAVKRDNKTAGIVTVPRNQSREEWLKFMVDQATEEAGVLPKAQDMAQETIEAIRPIRPAMLRNLEIVTKADKGLRKFGIAYTYFIRRSCIYRPCNEQLDTIMKIFFTDECFPYVSGEFELPDTSEYDECMADVGDADYCEGVFAPEQQWKKCRDAVNRL